MPDTRITALATGTVVDTAADWLVYVDVSDTSMAASGTDKKVSLATLAAALSPTALGAIGATTLLGNPTGSSAAPSVITLGAGLSFVGSTLVSTAGSGAGTVTTVSVVTANGISASVANPTTTPALTFTLGDITPTSVAASGTVTGSNLSNTNTGDQTFASLSPLTTLGDLLVFTTVNTRLAGNITTTRMFLAQTGAGASSAAPVWAQPAFTDVTGTVAAGQLPNPSATTLGGVQSKAAVTNQFLTSISTSGVPTSAQPTFANLSGTATVAQLPTTGLNITQSYQGISAPADGATITFDLSADNLFVPAALGGNRTLAVSNSPTVSPWAKFSIVLTQDATGSRTVTWFSGISWAGGSAPTLTTTANKRDVFTFLQTASGTYLGFVAGQNL
jgi:hypothetical protein